MGTLNTKVSFFNGKIEGKGKLILENGEIYIGEFLDNYANGKGKSYYDKDNLRYEGDFKKGKMEGNGKYICENGNYYIGEFAKDYFNGKGIVYYKNGDKIYEDSFANGKK